MARSTTNSGQSLVEALIAAAVGIILVVGAVGAISFSLRANFQNRLSQTGNELTYALLETVSAFGAANWHNLYDRYLEASTTPYYLTPSSSFFLIASGTEVVTINSTNYNRSFTMEAVYRDANDTIVSNPMDGTLDPSTLKIVASTNWSVLGQPTTISATKYLTRSQSRLITQTEWAGGPGHEEIVLVPALTTFFSTSTNVHYASSGMIFIAEYPGASSSEDLQENIDDVNYWAWNDVTRWIDMSYYNNVKIMSDGMEGYASSAIGIIAFDCATSPTQDCSVPFQVTNDGTGTLGGWAWNDLVGWISFASTSVSSTYGVTVDTNGVFHGFAWNDAIGWISFNCDQGAYNTCGTVNYYSQTLWAATTSLAQLISQPFDTQITAGAAFNNIMWQGTQQPGTQVRFQIATADAAGGPWNYFGPNGTITTYYQPLSQGLQVKINRAFHNNDRYIRYKVILESDPDRLYSPVINDILINWSP